MSNLTPIRRNPIFYDEANYEYETGLLETYFEEDLNQTVVVYEVDRNKTNTDDTYKEAKKDSIRYKSPKEIPCLFEIEDAELNAFDTKTNTGSYQISGNLTLYVLSRTLEKYRCEISRGDYVGVPIKTNKMAYFTITDDGKVNYSNKNYVGTYETAFRVIRGAYAQEFNGK